MEFRLTYAGELFTRARGETGRYVYTRSERTFTSSLSACGPSTRF